MMNLKEAKEYLEGKLESDLDLMTPKDRLNFYLGLMEYFQPKLNRVGYEQDELLNEIQIINATNEKDR